jgi:hypothetical protein
MDAEFKELKQKAYEELYPISSYVANLLRDDELATPPSTSSKFGKPYFSMMDCQYCIAGWAHDRTKYYATVGNRKYCETCHDLSIEMYYNYDGRQASKRLLKSILKFTEHFKASHK